jgi:polar amino acid transport system substrate-binding protein
MGSKFKYFIRSTKSRFIIILMLTIIILMLTIIFLGGLIYTHFPKETLPPTVFRIAIDETWYPLKLYDKEQYISAFSEDLLRKIAAQQHFSVQIDRIGSENRLGGLDNGQYEGILSSLILQEENTEKYISSNPYYLLGPVLVLSKSSQIKSLKDLKGKTIGLINRSETIEDLEKHSSINFVYYSYNDRSKLIDGMILNVIPAYEYSKDGIYRDQLKIASKPLTNEGLRLIAKNNPESKKLIEKFNEGLQDIKENGIYNQLLMKWELFNPEKSEGKQLIRFK